MNTATSSINRSGGSMTGTIQGAVNSTYNVTYTGNSKITGAELSGTGLDNVTVNLTAGQTATLDAATTLDGALTLTSGNLDVSASNFGLSVAGNWTNNSGTSAFIPRSGTVTLNGTAQTVEGSASTTFNNLTISSSTSTTLGINTNMSGGLTVSPGSTLSLTTFSLGATTAPTSLTMSGGATTGSSITGSGALTLIGSVTINDATTGTNGANISCPVALAGTTKTFTVADDGTSAVDLTVSGIVSNGAVIKEGAGTMLLSGTNTYSSGSRAVTGILAIGDNSALGTGALRFDGGNVMASGGARSIFNVVHMEATGGTVSGSNDLAFANNWNLAASSTLTVNNTGLTTITGGTFLTGSATPRTLTVTGSGNITFSNSIQNGAGVGSLTFNSGYSGTAILSSTNTYSGITTISSGELRLNPSAATATFASEIVLNGGKLSTTNIGASKIFTSSSTLKLDGSSSIDLGTNEHSLKFAQQYNS